MAILNANFQMCYIPMKHATTIYLSYEMTRKKSADVDATAATAARKKLASWNRSEISGQQPARILPQLNEEKSPKKSTSSRDHFVTALYITTEKKNAKLRRVKTPYSHTRPSPPPYT